MLETGCFGRFIFSEFENEGSVSESQGLDAERDDYTGSTASDETVFVDEPIVLPEVEDNFFIDLETATPEHISRLPSTATMRWSTLSGDAGENTFAVEWSFKEPSFVHGLSKKLLSTGCI